MENTEEPLLQLPPEETGAEETLPGIAPEPEAAEEAVAPAEAPENNESTDPRRPLTSKPSWPRPSSAATSGAVTRR